MTRGVCGQWDPHEASHFKTVELHLTAVVLKKRFEFYKGRAACYACSRAFIYVPYKHTSPISFIVDM